MKASQSSEILESTLRTAPEGHHWCATEAPGSSFWSHLIPSDHWSSWSTWSTCDAEPGTLRASFSSASVIRSLKPLVTRSSVATSGISPRHAPKSAHPINTTSACTAWVPNSKLENPIESCIQDLGRNEWKVDSKLQEKALGYNSYSSYNNPFKPWLLVLHGIHSTGPGNLLQDALGGLFRCPPWDCSISWRYAAAIPCNRAK